MCQVCGREVHEINFHQTPHFLDLIHLMCFIYIIYINVHVYSKLATVLYL